VLQGAGRQLDGVHGAIGKSESDRRAGSAIRVKFNQMVDKYLGSS
jgi:hypothetical protein